MRDCTGREYTYYPSGMDEYGRALPSGGDLFRMRQAREDREYARLWAQGYRPCVYRAEGHARLCRTFDCPNCLTGGLLRLAAPKQREETSNV